MDLRNHKPADPTSWAALSRRVRQSLDGWAKTSRSNFAFGIASLPNERRQGVVALYGFARVADDFADDEGLPLERRIASLVGLRADLDAIFLGRTPAHPASQKLSWAVQRFGVARPPLDALLDGVEADLSITRYPDFAQLKLYCQRVASAVGLACLPVFGCHDPRAHAYADALGLALQLTNIIRDVGEDARRGRIYLPADELAHFGVDPEELLRGRSSPRFQELMRFQAKRAREFEVEAERVLSRLEASDRRALGAAEIMRATYSELLHRIEAGGFNVLAHGSDEQHQLGLWRKATIACVTRLRTDLSAWLSL